MKEELPANSPWADPHRAHLAPRCAADLQMVTRRFLSSLVPTDNVYLKDCFEWRDLKMCFDALLNSLKMLPSASHTRGNDCLEHGELSKKNWNCKGVLTQHYFLPPVGRLPERSTPSTLFPFTPAKKEATLELNF
jgi:hypothetical protein